MTPTPISSLIRALRGQKVFPEDGGGTAQCRGTGRSDTRPLGTGAIPRAGIWVLAITFAWRMTACEGPSTANQEQNDDTDPCSSLIESSGWIRGEQVPSAAESTTERIRAVGDQTWALSLRMLEVAPSSMARNLANSATSFYAALGMMSAKYCAGRIAETLHFPESGDALHNTIGAGLNELAHREIPGTEHSDGVTVSFTNSVWALNSMSLPEEFGRVPQLYGAQPNALEVMGAQAREVVNCVIERDSHGLLKDFLPEGSPNALQTTLTVNVSYLAAPWATKMNERMVDFTPEGGTKGQVAGMAAGAVTFDMHDADTFTTVEVPLLGNELQVLFVVPSDAFSGTMDEFVSAMTAEALQRARSDATPRYIDFQMPQVMVESETIDFYGPLMFDCPMFTLEEVHHAGAVEMDPEGIKAAAATVAIGDGDSAPELPDEVFYIERPFLFFVHDPATGFVLFAGRYLGP